MGDILGIHHMSAICGPAQENLDFYAGLLGLRLVKLTVNFDDPSAHHLYYGDGLGNPGTLLTFFPYPNGLHGRAGAGQATVTHLAIPVDAISFWVERFRKAGVDFDRPTARGGHERLPFRAPDGLHLELVASGTYSLPTPLPEPVIPSSKAIGGIESITLVERQLGPTQNVLQEVLGFRLTDQQSGRYRYEVDSGGFGRTVEVVLDAEGPVGKPGHGTVHHIAFRTANEKTQLSRRLDVVERGLHVSAVLDRDYFRSIYFREPGGVLFEVATDGPGFMVDETFEALGTSLKLPKQHEIHRVQIERTLPQLVLPKM